jgi:hypothetical protein
VARQRLPCPGGPRRSQLRLDNEEDPTPEQRAFGNRLAEFRGYVKANGAWIPHYGERHRCGEAILSAFVESTVNQVVSKRMVKKQQMRWSPRGAHLLLQVRTRVLNDDLAGDFRRWYPGLTEPTAAEPVTIAASSARSRSLLVPKREYECPNTRSQARRPTFRSRRSFGR